MDIRSRYLRQVRRNCTCSADSEEHLMFWRNKLFSTAIIYLLPLSLIALLPSLYLTVEINLYTLALVEILTVSGIVIVGLAPGINLVFRKVIFIVCGYFLSFAIMYYSGVFGLGLIYLLAACIFSILIFSTVHVYWPAWLNTFICILFALIVKLDMLPPGDIRSDKLVEWIAVATHMIFLSFLCTALIPGLFKGLHQTIEKEIQRKEKLEREKNAIQEVSNELRHALKENAKTIDSSLDVICAVDAEGRFVRVSAACEEVWGYRADELIGKHTIDFVYADDHIETKKTAEFVRSGKNVVSFENRYVHKNGSIVPISWSVRWDENDQIRYAIARNVSEKRNLEKALDFERRRFFDLFQEAPMCMGVVSGPDYIYEVANPLYLELIGKNDIIGKSVREVLPAVIDQGFITLLDSVYKTGVTFSAKEMLLKLDIGGKTVDKYLNFTYQAHKNHDQEVDGIFCFAVEVTEEVLARKHIELSEMRLKKAQKIVHLGSWEIDVESKVYTWSDELYEIFGVERGEVIPSEDAFLSFIYPDDLEYVKLENENALKSLNDYTFDFRYITKQGLVRYGNSLKMLEYDSNQNPIRVYGILQDITNRKEVEQKLRNSESFNRGVLDSLNSNIAVVDFSGKIVAVNDSWNNFSFENGARRLETTAIGSNYFDVCEKARKVGEENAALACEGINDVINDKKDVFYLEYPCHSPQEKRWFGMRVTRFEGNQPMVVVSHQNISERKFAEFERGKVAKELVQRNKDLEQFTYIVSHNLRAPIANILGIADIRAASGLNKKEQKDLDRGLFESVDKLDNIVKDLNHILQVKNTMSEINQVVQFSQLVEDIKISIKNLFDIDDIEIQYDFSEINHFATLKSYIHSIFYNLITNSIKYRRSIPCIIKVESRLKGKKLQLFFTDNSLGIDLEKRGDQIFGLYKRFHSHVDGKGMGLFMVKAQVEKLGGKISIKSEVNKGTEFKIEFEI